MKEITNLMVLNRIKKISMISPHRKFLKIERNNNSYFWTYLFQIKISGITKTCVGWGFMINGLPTLKANYPLYFTSRERKIFGDVHLFDDYYSFKFYGINKKQFKELINEKLDTSNITLYSNCFLTTSTINHNKLLIVYNISNKGKNKRNFNINNASLSFNMISNSIKKVDYKEKILKVKKSHIIKSKSFKVTDSSIYKFYYNYYTFDSLLYTLLFENYTLKFIDKESQEYFLKQLELLGKTINPIKT